MDTNVVIAAFRSRRGASNALLGRVLERQVVPVCSTALFLEYEDVLSREETRAATGHTLRDVETIMSALATLAEPVDISFTVRPLLHDAGDEMVLEAAVNGRAETIVTHNVRDFRPASTLGIEIATPRGILRRLTI